LLSVCLASDAWVLQAVSLEVTGLSVLVHVT